MLHDWLHLFESLRWPAIAFFALIRFDKEIRKLLNEFPALMQRVKRIRIAGATLEADKLGKELPAAESEVARLQLPPPKVPKRPKKTEI